MNEDGHYEEDINTTVSKNFYTVINVMTHYSNYTCFDIDGVIQIAYGLLNLCERINRDVILLSSNSPVYNAYREAGVPEKFLTENMGKYFPLVPSAEIAKMLRCFIPVLKFLSHFMKYGFDDMALLQVLEGNSLTTLADLNLAISRWYQKSFHFPYDMNFSIGCVNLNIGEFEKRLRQNYKRGFICAESVNWFKEMINRSLYFDFVFNFSRNCIDVERISNFYN